MLPLPLTVDVCLGTVAREVWATALWRPPCPAPIFIDIKTPSPRDPIRGFALGPRIELQSKSHRPALLCLYHHSGLQYDVSFGSIGTGVCWKKPNRCRETNTSLCQYLTTTKMISLIMVIKCWLLFKCFKNKLCYFCIYNAGASISCSFKHFLFYYAGLLISKASYIIMLMNIVLKLRSNINGINWHK